MTLSKWAPLAQLRHDDFFPDVVVFVGAGLMTGAVTLTFPAPAPPDPLPASAGDNAMETAAINAANVIVALNIEPQFGSKKFILNVG
jgi:hypothetical protein